MRPRIAAAVLTLGLLVFVWVVLEAAQQPRGGGAGPGGAGRGGGGPLPAVGSMPTRRFQQITNGIYYATSTGSMQSGANSCVIVNDQDVLITDPGETPATAKAFMEDIKSITNKPVKYVVDTHHHFDHAHGNSIFGPDVTIIGHDRAYAVLAGNELAEQSYVTQAGPALLQSRLDQLKAQPMPADPEQAAAQKRQMAVLELRITQEKEVKPVPPNTTFSQSMTLHHGGREFQIWFTGRAHTDNDAIVFLPQEKIACTGDEMEAGTSYTADGFVDEWPATLEKLMTLNFDTALPGHGTPFTGKEHIRAYQEYLRDLSKQVHAFHDQGLSVEETAKRVDMTAHAKDFPQIRGAGIDVRGVQRMYDLIENPSAPTRTVGSARYPSK